jgi:hypothetical protein
MDTTTFRQPLFARYVERALFRVRMLWQLAPNTTEWL